MKNGKQNDKRIEIVCLMHALNGKFTKQIKFIEISKSDRGGGRIQRRMTVFFSYEMIK